MQIGGLIVAAGLSSRMKDFKPLMKIDNKELILNTVNSLKRSNIKYINIVVGYRGEEIANLLKNENVNIIYNKNYRETSMYDSFKIGLKEMQNKCEGIVFLPGDIGFVSKYTIDLLIKEISENNKKIVYPIYKNKVGHPPVISSKCFDYLLNYDGNEGLKGGMKYFNEESIKISTPDKFILFDMDYKEDFYKVKNYYENRQNLSKEECMYLLSYFEVPKKIINHVNRVSEICEDLSLIINKYKNIIDVDLLKSAAMLHDIKRTEKNHAKEGANLLNDLGYHRIAPLVKVHMKLEKEMENEINETTILYFCDKLVEENKFVNLENKFKLRLNRYKDNEEIKNNIMQKYNTTQKIKSNIISIIGEDEYEKLEIKWRVENDLFK